ncbi:efflux RND transporter permease subunit [Tepidamorphus sp. 3E244]|uniref:efflux RND transporter permease subunit n=1 Tax=Tepidamorphus sp. 3E244 TaxID=3385498 RepID=UPI0038FC1706
MGEDNAKAGRAHGPVAMTCARLAAWSVRNRVLVFALSAMLALAGLAGALRLDFNPDARVYFSTDAPERIALEEIRERFGPRRDVIAIVRPNGSDDADHLRAAAQDAREAMLALDGVSGSGTAAISDDLVSVHSGGELVASFLVSIDEVGAAAYEQMSAIEDAGHGALKGQYDLLLTGGPAQEAAAMTAIRSDLSVYVPIEVALIVGLLLLSVGSLTALGALLCVLGVGTLATMGGFGWSGAALNGVTSVVPSSLLGLSVATSVHVILAWQHGLRQGRDSDAARQGSVEINALPIVLATVTTVISFACLNFADSPAFHTFGTLVACGLTLTLVLSFTLLPALISALPPNPVQRRAGFERVMGRLGAFVCDHSRALLLLAVVVAGLAGYGVSQVAFRDNFSKYFDETFAFRQATDLYETQVGGITSIEFSVPVADGETITSPDYVADVAAFRDWALQGRMVAHAVAASDIYRAGGRDFGLTDDAGVPTGDAAAKTLLGGLKSRGSDPDLHYMLGRDFADEEPGQGATRVITILRAAASDDILEFAQAAQNKLAELGSARRATATGMAVLAAHLSERNGSAMIKATPIALVAISLLLVFALGSVRLGLASLIPNLMPLLMAYGIWGLVMGDLTFAGTMVIAMTFGIVVDDTVHIMSRYRHLRRAGEAPREAMIETFRTVGIAVVTTTVAIASGFSVLALSGFSVNRDLGAITTLTLLSALAATLVFLPPLLLELERFGRRRTSEASPSCETNGRDLRT